MLIRDGAPINRIPRSISTIFKSSCKIVFENHFASGFLIKFFKREQEFFCLMTNEHVINKDIIKQRKTIALYYDSETKTKDIDLFPDESYILMILKQWK